MLKLKLSKIFVSLLVLSLLSASKGILPVQANYGADFLNYALELSDFEAVTNLGQATANISTEGLTLSTNAPGDRLALRPNFDFISLNKTIYSARYDFTIPDTASSNYEFMISYQDKNNYIGYIFSQNDNSELSDCEFRVVRAGQISSSTLCRASGGWFQPGHTYTFTAIYNGSSVQTRIWPKNCYQEQSCDDDFYFHPAGNQIIVSHQHFAVNYGPVISVSQTENQNLPVSLTYRNFFVFNQDGNWNLPVPHFSQRDPAWKDDELGNARAFGNDATIGSHGCALTSAAMLLHYYGYTLMPDGQPLTPQTLNIWLRNEPGGYAFGTNLVWKHLVKLSNQIRAAQPQLEAREFKIVLAPTSTSVFISPNVALADLTAAGEPVIVVLTNHFMVATGFYASRERVMVNDPWLDEASSLLTTYSGPYGSLKTYRRFIAEENPNQSAIIINYTGALSVQVYNSAGLVIGQNNGGPRLEGQDAFQQIQIPIPADGRYGIRISHNRLGNSDPRRYNIMTYDQFGNEQLFFAQPYQLLESNSNQIRTLASSEVKPSQDSYSVSFNLDFSQDPEVENRLVLESPIDEINELWPILITPNTPRFVSWQLEKIESTWKQAGRKTNYNLADNQRYLNILLKYLRRYAAQNWLDPASTEIIIAQIEALALYLPTQP